MAGEGKRVALDLDELEAALFAELTDDNSCTLCGELMTIEPGDEQTRFCHACAHSVLENNAPELLRRARQLEKVEGFLREHGEAVVGACEWPSNPEARAAVEPMCGLLRSLGLDKETS